MNEKIREWATKNHEAKQTESTWGLVKIADDVTEAGIEIEDHGIDGLYQPAIYAAAAGMFGETSSRVLNGHNPCMIPGYIEYRQAIIAQGRELYPSKSRLNIKRRMK